MSEVVTYQHPLRNAKIAVYEAVGENNSPKFLAFIEPMSTYPVRFSGSTQKSALAAALAFCAENADKYEAAYVARAEARAAAKAKKEAGK